VRTPYKQHQGDFSQRAHKAAESLLYPSVFRARPDSLTFDETLFKKGGRNAALDAELAIDCVVGHKVTGHRFPLLYTVQERFRNWKKYSRYSDVTITTVNKLTKKTAELYKMGAQYFLYAQYDEGENFFPKAAAFETAPVLRAIARGDIKYVINENDRRQDFIAIEIDELLRIGAIFWLYPYGQIQEVDFVKNAKMLEVERPAIVPSEMIGTVRRISNWVKFLKDINK